MNQFLALKLWRTTYRVLLSAARPWVHARLWLRGRTEPEYRQRIDERFAHLPPAIPEAPVWFHTVSAGETIAAAPLINHLIDTFPDVPFLVTTMTPTGSAQVRKLLGDRVAHCYAPYDFPDTVRRFYDRVRPRLLVLMETELWPNLLREAAGRNVPALLVNARLSERSAAGYRKLGALTREMLSSLRFIACQYADHAERFLTLGAPPDRLGVLGSVKFDVTLPRDHAVRVAKRRDDWRLAGRPVWIAGSTHGGEEAVVLDAHRRLRERFPDALLLLVPRHPNRRDEVGAVVERYDFRYGRMSTGEPLVGLDVILADTMGELLYLYGLADAAFVGGSLVATGGHNPIEAAVCGQPIMMGNSVFNFPDVVAKFEDAGCLRRVADAETLAEAVGAYLADPALRRQAGESAAQVVRDNTGATARLSGLLGAEIRARLAASVGAERLQ
ncbi:MAG: lipid IV(A) 3-deoxy-D-manno-octulosonic acid transferase [Pseudomonadales bacterium]